MTRMTHHWFAYEHRRGNLPGYHRFDCATCRRRWIRENPKDRYICKANAVTLYNRLRAIDHKCVCAKAVTV